MLLFFIFISPVGRWDADMFDERTALYRAGGCGRRASVANWSKISIPVLLLYMMPPCTSIQSSSSVASRPRKEMKIAFGCIFSDPLREIRLPIGMGTN